jgi:hypothetical protein
MVEGVNSSMTYLIYCKKFCKCHNVLPPSTTIKKFLKILKKTLAGLQKKVFNAKPVIYIIYKTLGNIIYKQQILGR